MTALSIRRPLRRSVENLSYGAVVTYCSEVPGTRQGLPVDILSFTADEERALFQMFAIAEQASKRWDANVAIAQRLGDLMPGDTSLVIAAVCSDRHDAFDCCRFICDGFAERVPVRVD